MIKKTTDIQQKFYNALKRGTGEAYLIAKNNPNIDFSEKIIKGVLKNFAYDGQSENDRATYIFDLISISKNKEKIRTAVLNGIAEEQEDTWSLTHLFALAKLYAEQGDIECKKAIYSRFLHRPIEGSDWVGYQEILALDGVNGLLYIAEKFGKIIAKNPDECQDDFIIQDFQNNNPSIAVMQELENKAKTNPYIQLYLDNIKKNKEYRENNTTKTPNFNTIIDEIIHSKSPLSSKRMKELRKTELTTIAKRLLNEKNLSSIEKLLYVFTYYPFPLGSDYILSLAQQKTNSENSIKDYAIFALKLLKSEEIRTFALEQIPKVKNPATFTDILVSNYKSGDFKLLSKIAHKFNDEHIIESLSDSYCHIYTANKTKECKEPFEILYFKTNCGIHRMQIVEILIKNRVLSDKIKEEIQFDSWLKTRTLANKIK